MKRSTVLSIAGAGVALTVGLAVVLTIDQQESGEIDGRLGPGGGVGASDEAGGIGSGTGEGRGLGPVGGVGGSDKSGGVGGGHSGGGVGGSRKTGGIGGSGSGGGLGASKKAGGIGGAGRGR